MFSFRNKKKQNLKNYLTSKVKVILLRLKKRENPKFQR